MSPRRRIFLIDGNALAYRSFFAFIRSPLVDSKGRNTSAVFGFTTAVLRILENEEPDAVVVVFDPPGPTFRHEKFSEYKATREKMPDELRDQMPILRDVVAAMGLEVVEMEGFEADDVIGTLATKASAEGMEVFLVSGDKDFMQLVDERVKLYDPGRQGSGVEILGPSEVEDKFGVPPDRVVDVLALMGDSSDNVPGVSGIGPKTAVKLVREVGDLDAILASPDVKPPRIRAKLDDEKDQALLSRELVTIERDVPLASGMDELLRPPTPDEDRLRDLYRDLEFRSLLEERETTVESDEHAYHTVVEEDAIDRLVARLEGASAFVFDLETTSLDPRKADIVGLAFAFEPREAYYVPAIGTGDLFSGTPSAVRERVERFRRVLEDAGIGKTGQNIQYDALVLGRYDIELRGIRFDTMIASYCIEPGLRQHNLDGLAQRYLNYRKIPTSDLIGKGAKQKTMAEVPIEDVARYACEDVDITRRLEDLFAERMRDLAVEELFETIEMPLVPVLVGMERTGVSIDTELLARMSKELEGKIREIERTIHDLVGENFNVNSPKQLGPILFEKLEIHKDLGTKRLRKTKTGYATDQQTLERYSAHPIVAEILEFRLLSKLKSTYVDALPALVDETTGRLHTSFNQTVAATGRLSSSNPNLQNIPIRSEVGREIRKAFVPRDPSHRLLGADYSQIELRILAHLTGDEALVAAFRDGDDIHATTASLVFGVAPEDVTLEMRSKAKAINFGVIYGMGPDRLAAEVKISRAEAQEFIEAYFEKFSKVRELIDDTIEMARKRGYVTTILGRRRYLPEINGRDNRARRAAENMAVNTPIQGAAADLIKKAMIDVHRELGERGLEARMILQVHDELVFEAPSSELEELGELVRRCMEGSLDLRVPLVVDVKHGRNWYEAH